MDITGPDLMLIPMITIHTQVQVIATDMDITKVITIQPEVIAQAGIKQVFQTQTTHTVNGTTPFINDLLHSFITGGNKLLITNNYEKV